MPPYDPEKRKTIPVKLSPSAIANNAAATPKNGVAYIHLQQVIVSREGGERSGEPLPSLARSDPTSVSAILWDGGAPHLAVTSSAGLQLFESTSPPRASANAPVDRSALDPRYLAANARRADADGADDTGAPGSFALTSATSCAGGAWVVAGTSAGCLAAFAADGPGRLRRDPVTVDARHGCFPVSCVDSVGARAASAPGADLVASGAEDGSVSLTRIAGDGSGEDVMTVPGCGTLDDPCTAVRVCAAGGIVAAGFASGKVRLYAPGKGMVAEVCAHARGVTALAVDSSGSALASVAEDACLSVYNVTASAPFVEINMTAHVKDRLLQGVAFLEDGSIAAVPYDYEAITLFAAK